MASVATPNRRRRRALYLVLPLLALLAVAGVLVWQTWFVPEDPAKRYLIASVERGDIEDVVTATGTLQPRDYVDVGTQVSGQLRKVHVLVGQKVSAGELLAEIDPTVYRARVDADLSSLANLRAQLAQREAALVLARQQHARQQALAREDATTTEAVQTAEAELNSAKAQVEAVHAQIQQTESTLRGDEANLGYTKIYAPITGTVVSQTAKQGQTLNANQQAPIVLRIAELATMTVKAQVSEADVGKLKLGQEVYFTTLGDLGRRWYGKLRQIEPTPEVVNNVVLYNALFDVPNPELQLMTQMTAQVFFVTASARNALLVPLTALKPAGGRGEGGRGPRESGAAQPRAQGARGDGGRAEGRRAATDGGDARARLRSGRATVQVLAADGGLQMREVRVGVLSRVQAEVLDGLSEGEQVIAGERPAERPRAGAGGTGGPPPRL